MPLPTSFLSRGLCVPFETPLLRQVRLRIRPGQILKEWEAVIEHCGSRDQRQDMLVQWIHLTEWSSMTARDRLLHQAVSERFEGHDLLPLDLHRVVLQVEESLADREEDRIAIQAAMAQRRHDRFAAYISLLAEATRQCGVATRDRFMTRANSALLMRAIQASQGETNPRIASLTNRVLDYLVGQTGLTFQEVSKRIEELSALIAPIGAINLSTDPGAKQEGYLSLGYGRLRKFMEELKAHERRSSEADANEALLVLFSAKEFCDFVSERLRDVEQSLSSFIDALQRIKETREDVEDLINDIAYALDGWDGLIDVWNEASRIPDAAQASSARRRAIQHIILFLPMMPSEESGEGTKRVWNGISIHRAAMVRQFTNWLDDTLDEDLIARVKASQDMEKKRLRDQHRAAALEAEASDREARRRKKRQIRRALRAVAGGAV